MLFSLVPFISFNDAECLDFFFFWRRSKLVIIIKHFCVPLYLNQNRGSMWYCCIWPNATVESILKDCFYANQYASGPKKGWREVTERVKF